MADLTINEVSEKLSKNRAQISVDRSDGQYHAYVMQGAKLVAYERGDRFDQAVERVMKALGQ